MTKGRGRSESGIILIRLAVGLSGSRAEDVFAMCS